MAALAKLMERVGPFGCVLGSVFVVTFSAGRRPSFLPLKVVVAVPAGNAVSGIGGMFLMIKQDTAPYGSEENPDGFFGGFLRKGRITNDPCHKQDACRAVSDYPFRFNFHGPVPSRFLVLYVRSSGVQKVSMFYKLVDAGSAASGFPP